MKRLFEKFKNLFRRRQNGGMRLSDFSVRPIKLSSTERPPSTNSEEIRDARNARKVSDTLDRNIIKDMSVSDLMLLQPSSSRNLPESEKKVKKRIRVKKTRKAEVRKSSIPSL